MFIIVDKHNNRMVPFKRKAPFLFVRLFYQNLPPVLDVDALGRSLHALAVQVVDAVRLVAVRLYLLQAGL